MAIDNTPPRLKLIVTIAVITVTTLIAIDFATKSYYAMMTDEAKREKIAPTRDKDDQKKAEALAFSQAAVPIDQAMGQFEKGQRSEAITPTPSEDLAPETGWAKLPHAAPTVLYPVAMPPEVPMIGDGGVMLHSDGGVMLGPDGGVLMAPIHDAGAPADGVRGDRDGGTGRHFGRRGGGAGNGGGAGGGNGDGNGNGGGNH